MKVLILPGDGIGPEIVAQAKKVLLALQQDGLALELQEAPLGGAAYDQYGAPYPEFTQKLAREADAILLGAVGGPQYDQLERPLRPERGLLAIRKDLNLFANLRPAILYPDLANASTLKPEVVSGLDILIVRELTGDRRTASLDYEAYPEMALKKMGELEAEARRRWPIIEAAIVHRVGHLDLGEISIVIAVSTPHRRQSFEACQWLIDTFKEVVPIWKKELWADGSEEWVHPGMHLP